MTKEELQAKLIGLEIPKFKYSLEGDQDEKLCLDFHRNKWEIYYSERGGKSDLEIFDSEEEACAHFYELAKKYLTRKW